MIGRMFMSNETEAIKILEDFNKRGPNNVTYVVVYSSFMADGSDAAYADEGKWRWMAKIGGLDDAKYGNYTLGIDWIDENDDTSVSSDELVSNELGSSTVLYKLLHYARDMVLSGSSAIELEHFAGPPEGYFSQTSETIQTAFFGESQESAFAIMVCVFKVTYD
jgi:hypothetical protein